MVCLLAGLYVPFLNFIISLTGARYWSQGDERATDPHVSAYVQTFQYFRSLDMEPVKWYEL